jgi:hypothetical protein
VLHDIPSLCSYPAEALADAYRLAILNKAIRSLELYHLPDAGPWPIEGDVLGGGFPAMTALTTNDAFMMVNLRGRSTGLPCNIWLGQRGLAHEAPHIHVQPDHRSQFDLDNLAVVGVDPVEVIEGDLSAQDLALVRRYVLLNRQAILDHWNEYTDGVELIRALKSLVS